MNNTSLYILGSSIFFNIIKELEIFDSVHYFNSLSEIPTDLKKKKDNIVRVIFLNKNKKIFFTDNFPTIYISNNDYFTENKNKFSNFDVGLSCPIDILSFIEIIKILCAKYNFLQKSEIFIKGYSIDSNQKLISKNRLKIKLTEKELKLILVLKEGKRFNKQDLLKKVWNYKDNLESHAFETHLHRLRKKIETTFGDKQFITEEKSFYFL
jgi:hypothetical protein